MPEKGKGQEAEKATQTGAVIAPNAFQKLVIKMAGMATLEETSGQISGNDIIPILEAETEEDMWDADERPGWNAKLLSGCAIQIYGFEVKFGTGEDAEIKTPFVDPATRRQMYLLVTSARINKSGEKKEYNLPDVGEQFVWNTSARNIVAKLFWMLAHGWFDTGRPPVMCRIEGTPLSGGRSVEKLKSLDDAPVNASAEVPF